MKSRSAQPFVSMTARSVVRGFLAALFSAGVSTMLLAVYGLAADRNLPFIFIVILVVAFFGSQIQERMRRLATTGASVSVLRSR